jgi:transcriptional regulator with XRE-family HTH domain
MQVINGEALYRLRFAAGLSQAELARRAGVYPTTVMRNEAGTSAGRPGTIKKLADALGVGVDELCAESEAAA